MAETMASQAGELRRMLADVADLTAADAVKVSSYLRSEYAL